MRRLIVGAAAALALVAGAACGTDRKGLGDAPVGQRHEAPRQVWNSPDTFMNVAAFCIGENGAYVHTREAAPIIVPNDPNCDEGGILYEGG